MIRVKASAGGIRLSGLTRTWVQREIAGRLAGARSLARAGARLDLRIGHDGANCGKGIGRRDGAIRDRLLRRVRSDRDGAVWLEGEVPDIRVFPQADQVARTVSFARGILNALRVRGFG